MSVGYNLSFSDLLLVDNFAQAFGKGDKSTIEKILYENGMDVSQEVEEVLCTHRNLRGEVVNCILYQGHERNCKSWLSSGSASWSNIVESCDLDLRIALKTMSQQSNNTGKICAELERHAGN